MYNNHQYASSIAIKITRLEKSFLRLMDYAPSEGVDAFVDRIVSNFVSNVKGLEQHPLISLVVLLLMHLLWFK